MDHEYKKPEINCTCIDGKTIFDLKTALITSRDTYEDIAKKLEMESRELSPQAEALRIKAKKFHLLIGEIGKIKPC